MNDHENHVAISRVRNSSSSSLDRFGVSWGEELLDDEVQKKQKNLKYYASFHLDGTKYRQNDTVYLLSAEGPPYIGKIQTLYEKVKDREKQMFVRWFCRPSELPEGLPDVDYSENCKEVFMTWGNGAKNVNHPASILRHCSVLCTGGEEDWNTNFPSVEEIAAADHIFDRVYDLSNGTLRSLDGIVKQCGERYVTGKGGGAPGTKRASTSGKKFGAGRSHLDRGPLPLAMRASSDLLSLSLDCNLPDCSGLPALVRSPNSPHITSFPVEAQKESLLLLSSPSTVKVASEKSKAARSAHQKLAEQKMIRKAAAHQGSKRTHVNTVGNYDAVDSKKKRPRVESSNGLLPRQAQEALAGSRLPSPRVGEARKTSSNCPATAGASLPQQTQERRAGSKPPSPGAGEGRKKSLNGLTIADALLLQQAQDKLGGSKLPSPRVGDGRKKSSNDLTTADALLPQDAQKRLAGIKLPSPGAGDGGKKLSKDNKTAELYGTAVLNRERQKAYCKQNSIEIRKRLRADAPEKGNEESNLKKCKLSAPSHIVDVARKKEVKKGKANVSLTVPIDPKIGELRSPRVAENNLSENGSGRQQAQGREAHQSLTNQKQDGRVSSTLGERLSFATPILNEMKASPRNMSLDVDNNDARSLSPEVAHKRSTLLDDTRRFDPMSKETHCARKQSTDESNGDGIFAPPRTHTADAKDGVCLVGTPFKDSSPLKQSSTNLKSKDLEQDTKPFSKRSAEGLERREQFDMQNDVEGKSATLTKPRKASTSNAVVPPTSKENRLVNKGNQNVNIEGSQSKPSSARDSSLSSKRAGAYLEDSRHGEIGSPQKLLKKRPSSELEASSLKRTVMRKSDTQLIERQTEQSDEELEVKKIGLQDKSVPRVSTKNLSDETRSVEKSRLPPQGMVNKVAKTLARKPEPESAAKLGGRVSALHPTFTPADEHPGENFEPKKKIFNVPWEESLRIALEQRKALLLQNLDPWFSSSEIEAMLQDLLKTGAIDVRMLPPKSFTSYVSGQALVLFRTNKLAEQALEKLTENWLIWSKDERPVLASMADAEISASSRIHGFYSAEMFGSRSSLSTGEDQKNAVATSHCSQPNTVEYEMGIQWRLLQDRHAEAWTIAAKVQKATIGQVQKATMDHEGHQSKQIKQ